MSLLVKNLLFTLIAPAMAGGYVPWLIAADRPAASRGQTLVALTLFVAGGTIYFWCLWDFASFGRGTPAPIDAPKRLVQRGLYRCTRNPMYVGVLTAIAGWVVLFPALKLVLYALGIAALFHLFIVFYEEPHLREIFGEEYEQYCARVGRWIGVAKFFR